MTESSPKEMTFLEHLTELRVRLWICVITLFVSMVLAYVFSGPIINLLIRPLRGTGYVGSISRTQEVEVDPGGEVTTSAATGEELVIKVVKDGETATVRVHLRTPTGLYFTGLTEPFLLRLKVALYAGLILASPLLLFQLWRFIAPGLYLNERSALYPTFLLSVFFSLPGSDLPIC